MGSAQHGYLDGQLRASHPALFERFAAASARAVAGGGTELDVRYGPHPRQTFDRFRAEDARATMVYFHGGYWQSRDKADFRFLAPPLVADGFDVVLANYPLCPEASVAEIGAATAALMPHLAGPLILVGHSAGGQIVTELGMAACEQGWDVAGILAISGVFDLVPLVGTSLNDRLGLDEAAARAVSPLYRVLPASPPAVFAVGGGETAAFHEQTQRMAGAWVAAGNQARALSVAGADHFSILEDLCDRGSALRGAVRGFVPGGACASPESSEGA